MRLHSRYSSNIRGDHLLNAMKLDVETQARSRGENPKLFTLENYYIYGYVHIYIYVSIYIYNIVCYISIYILLHTYMYTYLILPGERRAARPGSPPERVRPGRRTLAVRTVYNQHDELDHSPVHVIESFDDLG